MKITVVHADTVNFTSSEATNIEDQIKSHKLKLEPRQAAILFSMTGSQAIIVMRPDTMHTTPGKTRKLYVSLRFRLDGGSLWQNIVELFQKIDNMGIDAVGLRSRVLDYAEDQGIHIERALRAVG